MKKAIVGVLVLVFLFTVGGGVTAQMQVKKSTPKKVVVVKKKVVKKVVVKKTVKQPAKAMKKGTMKKVTAPLLKKPEPMMKKPDAMMDKPVAEQQPAPVQTTVITYLGSAFSPSTLTVKLGTTVTFKNQGADPMWVASAMHPTHQLYPEFDQKSSSGPGSEYSFTFTKKGSWGFHDHLNPSVYGRIVVEE